MKKIILFNLFCLMIIGVNAQTKTHLFQYDQNGMLQEKKITDYPIVKVPKNAIDDPSQLQLFNDSLTNEVVLEPNPTKNHTTIFLKDYISNTEITYIIYSSGGYKVLEGKCTAASTTVDTSPLTTGVYFLSLKYGEKEIKQVLVIL